MFHHKLNCAPGFFQSLHPNRRLLLRTETTGITPEAALPADKQRSVKKGREQCVKGGEYIFEGNPQVSLWAWLLVTV